MVTEIEQDEKLNFRVVLPILVVVLVDLMGLTIIIPLLSLYAASYGANAFMIGLLSMAYPLMQFVGAPILGRLSDRFGRRPVLIVSQIGTLAGFLLLGFANSLILIFVSRIIDGISGANIATAQAAITDNTTEKNRTQGLGLIGAAFGLGFIIGPIIAFATLALSGNNYQMVAFVAAGFSLASILLTTFWFKESLPPEKRGKTGRRVVYGWRAMASALRQPEIGFLLFLIFFQQFAFGGFEQFLPLFTLTRLGMNASSNAMLFVYIGLLIVVVQGGLIGAWSRRFGNRALILTGLLLLGVSLVLTSITPERPVPWYSRDLVEAELTENPNTVTEVDLQIDLPADSDRSWLGLVWVVVALFPAAIGGGVLRPTINSLITQRVEREDVGGILGISTSFVSLANALTPLFFGAVFEWFGSTLPFLLGGLSLLLLYFFAQKKITDPKPDIKKS